VSLQTLARLIKEEDGGVFDPEDIAVMATAFDRLLADFKLVNRDDPIVTMLAKLVIELVRTGERDPERIRQQVLGRRSQSSQTRPSQWSPKWSPTRTHWQAIGAGHHRGHRKPILFDHHVCHYRVSSNVVTTI
jgi:hypothetical protein